MGGRGERGWGELLEAVARRAELERLFGLEELYPRPLAAGAPPAPAVGESRPRPPDELRARAVEAARARARAAQSARAAPAARERPPAQPAPAGATQAFTIEELPGADEMALFSEAERAGIPRVSAESGTKAERLARLAEVASRCTRCGLAATRKSVVFGEGDPGAALVFVGEAPGADEDATGRPFVGRAGKLLTKIIEAMGFAREEVYICNVLKCRPPGNRAPAPEEVLHCSPYLHEQLAVIEPRAICALGGPAATTLLGTKEGITRLRGRLFRYRGTPLMPTFHPAYLLRNMSEKGKVWEDMKKLKAFLASLGVTPRGKT